MARIPGELGLVSGPIRLHPTRLGGSGDTAAAEGSSVTEDRTPPASGPSDAGGPARRRGVDTSLRTAAVWAEVAELTTERQRELGRPLRVLDLGGGTGGLAVPLAESGHTVTVVDPSPDALASLRRRTEESTASGRISAVQGDADTLGDVLAPGSVDLVCCHGTLEVVDDPDSTLSRIADVLAPGGYLSLVTAQRLAAVLARAVAGRFDQAQAALTSPDGRWGDGDPMPRRFDQEDVEVRLDRAGFTVVVLHGVRIFSDLVPGALLDSDADKAELIELERAAVADPDRSVLSHLGSQLHALARKD